MASGYQIALAIQIRRDTLTAAVPGHLQTVQSASIDRAPRASSISSLRPRGYRRQKLYLSREAKVCTLFVISGHGRRNRRKDRPTLGVDIGHEYDAGKSRIDLGQLLPAQERRVARPASKPGWSRSKTSGNSIGQWKQRRGGWASGLPASSSSRALAAIALRALARAPSGWSGSSAWPTSGARRSSSVIELP